MSDTVIVALIAASPGIITAIMQGYNRNRLIRLEKKTDTTHRNINGRMDELLDRTKESSYAEGVKAGRKGGGYD